MLQSLSLSDTVSLVRKNLDEVDPNGSVMYTDDDSDNSSLDDIIARNLPEAINAINLSAPVTLLEGTVLEGSKMTDEANEDGVLSFSISEDRFLRFVAFKATDSDIVVTDVLGESTAEGRKQLNKWLRGQYDCPRLVLLHKRDQNSSKISFKYYSLKEESKKEDVESKEKSSYIEYFEYIKELVYSENTAEYKIASRLRQNIIDCLTAMVMEIYSDQRAQYFLQKANNFSRL